MESNRLEKLRNRPHCVYGHSDNVIDVDWNCDGAQLASAGADCSLRITAADMLSKNEQIKSRPYEGHTQSVNVVRWSKINPNILATASSDATVKIWDTRIGRSSHSFPTSERNLNMDWDPAEEFIVVGSNNDKMMTIDTRAWKALTQLPKEHEELNIMRFAHDGKRYYAAYDSGKTSVVKWPSMQEICLLRGHTDRVMAMAVDPLGKRVVFGGNDALVSIWTTDRLVCTHYIDRLESPIRGLEISYDGKYLAIASDASSIDIASMETGERLMSVNVRGGQSCLAWHPKELLLACARSDNSGRDCPVFVHGYPEYIPQQTLSYRGR